MMQEGVSSEGLARINTLAILGVFLLGANDALEIAAGNTSIISSTAECLNDGGLMSGHRVAAGPPPFTN